MTTATELHPHRVELTTEDVLMIAYDGEAVMVVLYRRRKPNDKAPHIDIARYDDLVRRGILPRGYHTSWARVSSKAKTLKLALDGVFNREEYLRYADEINSYVKQIGWGQCLP